MKTILWATLSANGNYARSSAEHPPKREALEDFAAQVRRAGNFIVGRKTFEGFQAQQQASAGPPPFAGVDIVVVTTRSLSIPGISTAVSPRAALDHLTARGHATALIAGGETLHDAFLADDLVDELVLDVAPVLEDEGLKIRLPRGARRDVRLLETKLLGGDVVQLRYGVERR